MRVKRLSMKTIFQTHMYIPASQINIHVMGHMFYIAVADPGGEGGGGLGSPSLGQYVHA